MLCGIGKTAVGCTVHVRAFWGLLNKITCTSVFATLFAACIISDLDYIMPWRKLLSRRAVFSSWMGWGLFWGDTKSSINCGALAVNKNGVSLSDLVTCSSCVCFVLSPWGKFCGHRVLRRHLQANGQAREGMIKSLSARCFYWSFSLKKNQQLYQKELILKCLGQGSFSPWPGQVFLFVFFSSRSSRKNEKENLNLEDIQKLLSFIHPFNFMIAELCHQLLISCPLKLLHPCCFLRFYPIPCCFC